MHLPTRLRNRLLPALAVVLALGLSACELLYPDDDTPPQLNAFEYIAEAPELQTLEVALVATGLDDDLQGDGPFTVFAPTDSAFTTVDVEALLERLDELRGVLAYHVVAGQVIEAGDIADGATVATLEGSELVFTVGGSGVMVNDENVIEADIEVSNGVIHLIDGVLLPPDE